MKQKYLNSPGTQVVQKIKHYSILACRLVAKSTVEQSLDDVLWGGQKEDSGISLQPAEAGPQKTLFKCEMFCFLLHPKWHGSQEYSWPFLFVLAGIQTWPMDWLPMAIVDCEMVWKWKLHLAVWQTTSNASSWDHELAAQLFLGAFGEFIPSLFWTPKSIDAPAPCYTNVCSICMEAMHMLSYTWNHLCTSCDAYCRVNAM